MRCEPAYLLGRDWVHCSAVAKRRGLGAFALACFASLNIPAAAQQATSSNESKRELPILVSDSKTGYIDNAIVGNQFQVRFDAIYDVDRPDRAEFFYAKCGCFREVGADPAAPGPAPSLNGRDPLTTKFVETSVDAYRLSLDLEYAFSDKFSVFANLPFTSLHPEVNSNAFGVGDIQAGLKYALLVSPRRYLTFQLRAYAPSGDAKRGLGTDHWSVEPGLLYFDQIGARTTLAAELRYFYSIDGSSGRGTGFSDDFHGNVLRYGVGMSHEFGWSPTIKVAPVVELVGWYIFDGLESVSTDGTASTFMVKEASGSIVNLKLGARIRFGEKDSIYVGVGHALTQKDWYENVVRVEYRRAF